MLKVLMVHLYIFICTLLKQKVFLKYFCNCTPLFPSKTLETNMQIEGRRHSSVVSSAPFQFVLLKLYRGNNENRQKRGLAHLKKTNMQIDWDIHSYKRIWPNQNAWGPVVVGAYSSRLGSPRLGPIKISVHKSV